jgi:hypothetical protein
MTRRENLNQLAEQAAGLHFESPAAKKILDTRDWDWHWPVINAAGILTGEVVDSDELAGYGNVDDLAMVPLGELVQGQEFDLDEGYVSGIPKEGSE